MNLQGYIDHHPYLAAAVTLAAGWLTPTPANCRRWLVDAGLLVKGAHAVMTTLNTDQVNEVIKEAQKMVKLGLNWVPGDTPDEKAANLTAEIKPLFDAALANLGLPGFVNDFAGKVFGWMVAAEVKAAYAA